MLKVIEPILQSGCDVGYLDHRLGMIPGILTALVPLREQQGIESAFPGDALSRAQPSPRQHVNVQSPSLFRGPKDVVQHSTLHCDLEVLQDLLKDLSGTDLVRDELLAD
jgi:hypothetical protein